MTRSVHRQQFFSVILTVLSASLFIVPSARAQDVVGPMLGPRPAWFIFEVEAALTGGISHNLLRTEPERAGKVAGLFAISPTIRLGNPLGRQVRWWANLSSEILVPATDEPTAGDTSTLDADLRVTFFPRGAVTLNLSNLARRTRTSPDLSVVALDPTFSNRFSAELRMGSNDVEAHLGYDMTALRHLEQSGADMDAHLLTGGLTYRFGRHAELFARASVEWVSWPDPDMITSGATIMPVRATAGVEGFMTRHFWGRLSLGYAEVFNVSGDRFQSGIGELSFGWGTRYVRVSTGIRRGIEPAYWGRFVSDGSAFFRLDASRGRRRQAGRFSLRLDASYHIRVHGEFSPPNTTIVGLTSVEGTIANFASHAERQGQFLRAEFSLDVAITDWFAVVLSYEGTGVISNFRAQQVVISDSTTRTQLTVWNWRTHVARLGFSFFY